MSSIATSESRSRGKRWAYTGAAVGGVVSVLANVTHSYVPSQPHGMSDETWRSLANAHPQPGAVWLAAFWPAALLLAIEILARVEWPDLKRWTLVRWGGVTPVAVVAAIVSYRHLSGLLLWYGEDPLTVSIGPLAVDGLMVVSTGALLALASRVGAAGAAQTGEETDGSDGQPDGSLETDGETDGRPTDEPTETGEADGPARMGGLALVPAQVAPPAELAHARRLIREGRLTRPYTADRILAAIKDDGGKLGLPKARAIRDALNTEPEDDQQEA